MNKKKNEDTPWWGDCASVGKGEFEKNGRWGWCVGAPDGAWMHQFLH